MKFYTFIKITLFSLCVYHAQAAATDVATATDTAPPKTWTAPTVNDQMKAYNVMFSKYEGQDLATAHMPELIGFVDMVTGYLQDLVTGANVKTLAHYQGEMRAAASNGTLTFPLYYRFILGITGLTTGADTDTSVITFSPTYSSLHDAAWEGVTPYNPYLSNNFNSMKASLKLGYPCVLCIPQGHFGFKSLVQAYLDDPTPRHLIGIPRAQGIGAHGEIDSIKKFLQHDISHAGDFADAFKGIWPFIRAIFKPAVDNLPATDPLAARRLVGGLYFLLHEDIGREELGKYLWENLEKPVLEIGNGLLKIAQQNFANRPFNSIAQAILYQLLPPHHDSIALWIWPRFLEARPAVVKFTGNVKVSHTLVEAGILTIHIPEEIGGEYKITYEPQKNYLEELRTRSTPEDFPMYEKALKSLYGIFKADAHTPGKFVSEALSLPAESLRNIFNNAVVDEYTATRFMETAGPYDPTPPPYTWASVFKVRGSFQKLFAALQEDLAPIWAVQPALDRALVESTRAVLKAELAPEGSAVGGAAAAAGAGAST